MWANAKPSSYGLLNSGLSINKASLPSRSASAHRSNGGQQRTSKISGNSTNGVNNLGHQQQQFPILNKKQSQNSSFNTHANNAAAPAYTVSTVVFGTTAAPSSISNPNTSSSSSHPNPNPDQPKRVSSASSRRTSAPASQTSSAFPPPRSFSSQNYRPSTTNSQSNSSTSRSYTSLSSRPSSSSIPRSKSPPPTDPPPSTHLVESAPMAPDGIMFAQLRGVPNSLVVYRSRAAREANPERLNLDRRKLTQCPILENEERIRLLNYQNNRISSIGNLNNLGNLIFLDLYNNHITNLTEELSGVRTLRVLMLGKNRINKISHLDKLNKLDVLDLHSNYINKMENLNSLNELRVLNLAGNNISTVENVGHLQSLTELNLRRNKIGQVFELNLLPNLQRVFLSNNSLEQFEDAGCVFKIKFLLELALDGNPMVESMEQKYPVDSGVVISKSDDGSDVDANGDKIVVSSSNLYRSYVIENIKTLKHFDLRRVTDEERRQAAVLKKRVEDKKRQQSKKNKSLEDRKNAIKAAERAWAAQNGSPHPHNHNDAILNDHRASPITAPHGSPHSRPKTADTVLRSNNSSPSKLSPSGVKDDSEIMKPNSNEKSQITNKKNGRSSPTRGFEDNNFVQSNSHQFTMKLAREMDNSPPRPSHLNDPSSASSNPAPIPVPRPGYRTVFSSLSAKSEKNLKQKNSAWKGYFEIESPEVETGEDEKVLHIFGDGFSCFSEECAKMVFSCGEIHFHYVDIDTVMENASNVFLKTAATKLVFSHNALKSLNQLKKLSVFWDGSQSQSMLTKNINEIAILTDGNPVDSLSLLRVFLAFSLPRLEVLDGVEITQGERGKGMMLFAGLKRLSADGSSAKNIFKTGGLNFCVFHAEAASQSASQMQSNSSASSRAAAKANSHLDLEIAKVTEQCIVSSANVAIERKKAINNIEKLFPTVLAEIVEEALEHSADAEAYMQQCLENLPRRA
ncbi:hypothetical protein TrST_g3978 [Triparma strigata]|uniref:Uncharacterized protein n=1 Tax=Triparma strigata TaxID=1606541 RepID=A0A9W7E0K1_9STRA|nr:hypothetical protein TrST_g3978 [Triparma strigata]